MSHSFCKYYSIISEEQILMTNERAVIIVKERGLKIHTENFQKFLSWVKK